MSDLDDVLEGSEATGEEITSSPEGEAEQEKTESIEEAVEETHKEEPKTEIHEDKEQEGLKAALAAERRKRQEYELELQEIKSKEEKPDFWEDPDSVIDQRVRNVEKKLENRFLNMSEYYARNKHDDFDEVSDYFFNDLAEKNPALVQEALSMPDPYEHIYQTASKHRMVNEITDIDSYKSKLRAEIQQEMEAEKNAAIEAALKKTSELPGTLSKESAASAPTQGAGDESLEDLMGR